MTRKLISGRGGEYNTIAVEIHASAKIRLQDIDQRIQIGGTEVAADLKGCQPGISNDELALVVAIELDHDVGERIAVEHQHLVLPGELAGEIVLGKVLEFDAVATGGCSLAGRELRDRHWQYVYLCF